LTTVVLLLALMLLLVALQVPIAVAMALPGIAGFVSIVGIEPTLFMIGETTFSTVVSYTLRTASSATCAAGSRSRP
jgi:C4-dicarboxylate transporter DctM subunit